MTNIFYGIPSESNIRNNIDKWINVAGTPEVFSAKDEDLHKYQTKLLGKYDVISLDEALKRYPSVDVWVTYRKADNTGKMLLTKIPPEKIHFLEADLEYRRGCNFLGRHLFYRQNNFSPCCISGKCPIIQTSGTISQRLTQWKDDVTKLIDDIRNEKPNKCQNCHLLNYGFWHKSVKLSVLGFLQDLPGDECNFNCVYCFARKKLDRLKDDDEGLTTCDIIRQLSEMPELDTEDFAIRLANGEFCVNKYCDEMLDIFSKTKWKIVLRSNCSIYKEKLATLMESGRIRELLTSLDAGTRETFKKIKQVDCFDKVVENLRKYPLDKTRFLLKYIFLEGLNDNETDVDGFYEIAKEIKAIIMFSADYKTNATPYTKKMRELTLRIINKAKADSIKIHPDNGYLNPQDAKFIKEYLTQN